MASNFDPNDSDMISEINITPFVDVVLVLLVIFMVTAPMMVQEVMSVKLPKSKSSEKSESKTIAVSLSKAGQIIFNGKMVDASLLYDLAVKAKNDFEDLQLIISADKEAKHGDVIVILDKVKQAGINNFAFQIEKIVNE